jgi:hypothetical protein
MMEGVAASTTAMPPPPPPPHPANNREIKRIETTLLRERERERRV